MQHIWSQFDSIYCINLYEREDKYIRCKRLFEEWQCPAKFYRVNKHPRGGKQGCFESHMNIIALSYDSGDERCFIFEDDVLATKAFTIKNMQVCMDFINNNTDWDIFYFGCMPDIRNHITATTSCPNIMGVNAFGTHAYVINRRFMRKLIGSQYQYVGIDQYYINHARAYTYRPDIFIQDSLNSDIEYSFDFYNWQNFLWARLFLWNLNNAYAYNINLPVFRFAIALVLVSVITITFLIIYKIVVCKFILKILLGITTGISITIITAIAANHIRNHITVLK
jgi:glycosyl transferase, family 25